MKFEGADKDDRAMRQRVLTTLLEVDKAIQGRHVVQFEVARTVNRKGYRTARPFNDCGPHGGSDPKTVITVIIEVPDDVRPSFRQLVADITKIEADGIRAAKEAKVAEAREVAARALAEVDRLERELNGEEVEDDRSNDDGGVGAEEG